MVFASKQLPTSAVVVVFPGLVAAACLPDHDFTLIEPMERRIEWLHECVGLMQLQNVEIIRGRPMPSSSRYGSGKFIRSLLSRVVRLLL